MSSSRSLRALLPHGVVLGVLAAVALPDATAQRKPSLTVPEALKLAFGKCEVKRETLYLDKAQRKRIHKLSGERISRGVAFRYVARKDGKLVGTAYFDAHRVRTLREVLMVVVSPAAKIARVEVLAFAEPVDYLPGKRWYAQFRGRGLDVELNLRRGVKGVAGATLTARATVRAARRTLALHRVVAEVGERPPEPRKKPKTGSETRRSGDGAVSGEKSKPKAAGRPKPPAPPKKKSPTRREGQS